MWLVQRPHTQDADLVSHASKGAPQGNVAVRASRHYLALTALRWHLCRFGRSLNKDNAIRFDLTINCECATRFALAVCAMAAVDDERRAGKLVASFATETSSGDGENWGGHNIVEKMRQ